MILEKKEEKKRKWNGTRAGETQVKFTLIDL